MIPLVVRLAQGADGVVGVTHLKASGPPLPARMF